MSQIAIKISSFSGIQNLKYQCPDINNSAFYESVERYIKCIILFYKTREDYMVKVFGLISVLQPFNTFQVISGTVSYPNCTVPGQASRRQFTST